MMKIVNLKLKRVPYHKMGSPYTFSFVIGWVYWIRREGMYKTSTFIEKTTFI